MGTKTIILFFLITFYTNISGQIISYPHYEIDLDYNPSTKEITVDGILKLPSKFVEKGKKWQIEFYKSKWMKIHYLTVNDIEINNYNINKCDVFYFPQSEVVSVEVDNIDKNVITQIKFSLAGTLDNLPGNFGNITSEAFTELGIYYTWYPLLYNEAKEYTYVLRVKKRGGYEIFGLGDKRYSNNEVIISSNQPTNDIVVCFAKQMNNIKINKEGVSVELYHHSQDITIAENILEDIFKIIREFKLWFSDTKNSSYYIIESAREKGGGYGRLNGVVIDNLAQLNYNDYQRSYVRYFAHEIAHRYWYKADPNTWEDWLNESIAEYCALMIIRKFYGDQVFSSVMEKKRIRSANSPKIWEFDRKNTNADEIENVLYHKGPAILCRLESKIGTDSFIQFLRNIIKNEANTTEKFLLELRSIADQPTVDWFKSELNK